MRQYLLIGLIILAGCSAPNKEEKRVGKENQKFTPFKEVSSLSLEGGFSAAEISAYYQDKGLLFVTNNAKNNRVDIISLKDPANPQVIDSIEVDANGDQNINSIAVGGNYIAVAASAKNPQEPGHVFLYNISDFSLERKIGVGSLPDMVTFSPDGKSILTANEGEPSQSYEVDPVGSVSLIRLPEFSVTRINFNVSPEKLKELKSRGLRVFGPNASVSQDLEPEYITVSSDSKFAWVSLQENNAIAKIDIDNRKVTDIFPLGFKDFSLSGNEIDVCDNDSININKWPIKGIYQPDAIEVFEVNGKNYILSANEGDSRDYEGYSEISRVSELVLDPNSFSNLNDVQKCDELGRLIVTTTMGDFDKDGDYDELYTFGSRSFSVWDGETGELIMDSKGEMERDLIANSKLYDDNRSDDKGTEPEGIAIGKIGATTIAVIALERANAVMIYDLQNPRDAKFLQVLETGTGPEGVLFINSSESPNQKPLIVVSSEVDGKIKLYQPE